MNAYELAEQAKGLAYEIPADWSSGEPKNVATEIATMLLQQAKRINDLEKDLALKTRDRDVFCNFTLAYEKRIEELEVKVFEYEFLLKGMGFITASKEEQK